MEKSVELGWHSVTRRLDVEAKERGGLLGINVLQLEGGH
jgi:hypothetical protein